MQKVTKKQFIQVIENNESGRPDKELAVDIGISHEHFSRLKNKYKAEIKDAARAIIQKNTVTLVNCLIRNAKNKDSQAAKILLDMEKTLDLEVAIKKLQSDIAKIKEIQVQQAEKAEFGLYRKAVNE